MRDKEFMKLQKENKVLRELLREGIQFMEICVEKVKCQEDVCKQKS
ncbi:hypothetical protein [Clostridium kluyveri]|nr:hypothetical protein [Clostridium kluyveri]